MSFTYEDIDGWFSFAKLYSQIVSKINDDMAVFVEVGTYKGRSAAYMANEIKNSGKAIQFFAVDYFENPDIVVDLAVSSAPPSLELFIENMTKAGVVDYVTPFQMSSIEASTKFPDNSLDFVFIDANHWYDDVMSDLNHWYPKVKMGGVISGHDYTRGHAEVIKAVDYFFGRKPQKKCGNCWWIDKTKNLKINTK